MNLNMVASFVEFLRRGAVNGRPLPVVFENTTRPYRAEVWTVDPITPLFISKYLP